ncbi:ricin-type beta-trefoil lectin domain protein [Nonomuraea sp. NPDC026600]|uniref:ricin-type beta-trefoil lectin domain protein n=1 Tax=Nonomuraea sp. NPDC026600 TaxID=3155363 RepID=UPI0033FAE8F6
MTTTPQPGSVFYIASRIQPSTPAPPFVLAAEGNGTQPGTRVILYPRETDDAQSQFWTVTDDGHLLSQLNGLAINWDPALSALVLQAQGDPGYPCQLWSITDDGYVHSLSMSGQVLSAPTLEPATPSATDAQGLQHWTPMASTAPALDAFRPRWVYFQSAVQDADQNDCVLKAQGGSHVAVCPQTGNDPGELWQVTPDGRILNRQGAYPALKLGAPCDEGGNYLTVDTDTFGDKARWDLSVTDQIRSVSSVNFLVSYGMTGGSGTLTDGDPVVAAPGTFPSPPYTWYTVPSAPLDAILTQPSVPFPEFIGDQAQAYQIICQRLGVTSLRDEYPNLTRTLSDYGDQIEEWTDAPQGILQTDWDAVRLQLTTEISYADAARDLFTAYEGFQQALFSDKEAITAQLVSDAGITIGTEDPDVTGAVLSILEGLLYAGLSAAGEEFSVAANLMQTGINAALAADSEGGGSISPDPFQVAVSGLWKALDDDFTAVLTSIGNMETPILQDWGRLQSVYQLSGKQGGGDSLYWGPSTTAEAVIAASPGFTTSVMQLLMSVKYQIFTSSNGGHPAGIPDYAQWQSGGVLYWIAEIGNPQVYPSSQAMQNDLWNNGVQPWELFSSASGWAFPMTGDQTTISYSYGRFTFTNQTPNIIQVVLDPVHQLSLDVLPYQSAWADLPPSGVTNISVVDVITGKEAAVFQMSVSSRSPTVPGGFWIGNQASLPGYSLTQPLITPGLCWYLGHDSNAYASAAAQIGVIQL